MTMYRIRFYFCSGQAQDFLLSKEVKDSVLWLAREKSTTVSMDFGDGNTEVIFFKYVRRISIREE